MGRREMASALGLSFAELEAMAAADPRLAAALERAEDEAWVWWEDLPRRAFAARARFNLFAWREAMHLRFEDEAHLDPPREPPAVFLFPDNGTTRGRPNGYRDDDGDDDEDDESDDDTPNEEDEHG
jgi:hypothetical protein